MRAVRMSKNGVRFLETHFERNPRCGIIIQFPTRLLPIKHGHARQRRSALCISIDSGGNNRNRLRTLICTKNPYQPISGNNREALYRIGTCQWVAVTPHIKNTPNNHDLNCSHYYTPVTAPFKIHVKLSTCAAGTGVVMSQRSLSYCIEVAMHRRADQ